MEGKYFSEVSRTLAPLSAKGVRVKGTEFVSLQILQHQGTPRILQKSVKHGGIY